MTPSNWRTVICKEGTITLARQTMTQAISAVAQMKADATEYIFHPRALCIWIRRIHSRVHLRSLSTVLWILCWVILLTPLFRGLGHRPEEKITSGTGRLAWSIDLRSVGFTDFAPKQEQWGLHLRPNPLCFTDNNVVSATFITQEQTNDLAHRDQPDEALPLRLHAIFLDAESGKVRASKEWFLTRPRGGVIAVGSGRFAALTPAMIAVYSPSFELEKDFKLSSKQQSELWDFRPSPSGKSIVAEYHTAQSYFQWIDTNTLLPRSTFIPNVSFSISDDDVVVWRNPYIKSKGSLTELLIQTADGPWRTICRVLNGQDDTCSGRPQFLSNDLLALVMPHGFNLMLKTGGDAFFKMSFHKDEWLDCPLYPSRDGKRIAVTVWGHKGGSAILDTSSRSRLKRIEIYDLSNLHAVFTLDAKQQKIQNVTGVALSPDGSMLAILTEGFVKVYQLPLHTPTH
jgi:hypothetical protein